LGRFASGYTLVTETKEIAMSQSDIDPDDELLITGDPDPVEEQEWDDGDEEKPAEAQRGRLEEREERQHGVQQHGDTFAVDSGASPY